MPNKVHDWSSLREVSLLHGLGNTRSSWKSDHLLHTPDAFIRTALPGATGVEFVVHCSPRLAAGLGSGSGAGFTQMTAEFSRGGVLAAASEGVERFVFVLEGSVEVRIASANKSSELATTNALNENDYAFLPAGTEHSITAVDGSRVVILEKRYQAARLPLGFDRGESILGKGRPFFGQESSVVSELLGGDEGLEVRRLMPDGVDWDFAVNTMTYAPGAALAMVEVHVMEHGLLMLEGGGIYRLGDRWYPVTAGDFIWMAPYCPQWFGALGKTPAKYLIYKDWYRHPLSL